jgi:hypothetical protein
VDEWFSAGRYYDVTVFSDVSSRDGLGWELEDIAPAPGRGYVMEIFREDSAAVPILTCKSYQPVPPDIVTRFTQEATADVLHGVLGQDRTGWLTKNIARALALAGQTILRWSGPEWPLEVGDQPSQNIFAPPGAERVPFSWLRAQLIDGAAYVSVYQDSDGFGLNFLPEQDYSLEIFAAGALRPHHDAALPTGLVEQVELVIDNSLPAGDVILSELTMRIDGQSVLLMAAEPVDGDHDWRLYDESVTVLRDPTAADRLDWVQQRPTHGRPRG